MDPSWVWYVDVTARYLLVSLTAAPRNLSGDRCGWAVSPRSCPLGLQRGGWTGHWRKIGGPPSLRLIWVLGPPCLHTKKNTKITRGFCSDSRNAYTSHISQLLIGFVWTWKSPISWDCHHFWSFDFDCMIHWVCLMPESAPSLLEKAPTTSEWDWRGAWNNSCYCSYNWLPLPGCITNNSVISLVSIGTTSLNIAYLGKL